MEDAALIIDRKHPADAPGTKKGLNRAIQTFFCARNRTRTCTALRPLVPETSVSTNFTIRADT